MFRYLYPLSKKAKKLMENNSTLNWLSPYPKDKDLEWKDVTVRKNTFNVTKPQFTFQDAVYNSKNIESHKKNKLSTLEKFL